MFDNWPACSKKPPGGVVRQSGDTMWLMPLNLRNGLVPETRNKRNNSNKRNELKNEIVQ